MKLIVRKMRWLAVISILLTLAACSDEANLANVSNSQNHSEEKISLDVYKSRRCGCCQKWVDHVEVSGFEAVLHHPRDLNKLKAEKGVPSRHQSCHTAVSIDGYVFEGHIPAHIIRRFLANPPQNSIGLAVPGMPMGSPGMEVENRQDEYDVLLLNSDGSDSVYEHISAKH